MKSSMARNGIARYDTEFKLYKKGKNGETRVWRIYSDGPYINISHGKLGGTMTRERLYVEHGKAGRSWGEQVDLKIKSRINKKMDGGYVEDIEKIDLPLTNQLGFKRPMLASKVNYAKVDFKTATVQRKYNGHRCLILATSNGLQAYSRGGKPITSIDHILAGIALEVGETLDGELYAHGQPLQAISSLVRRQNQPGIGLTYTAYDMISGQPFQYRLKRLEEIADNSGKNLFRAAETFRAIDMENVERLCLSFIKNGYEGAIVRHGNSGYEVGQRSKSLMKVKKFLDSEFLVNDVIESVEGWGRLVCETSDGLEFKCSAPGNHAQKREILVNKEKYIGKFITIKYPELTSSGKPSQPVAVDFRDEGEF